MGKGMRAGKKPSSGMGGGSMQKQLQQMQAMQRKMEMLQAEIDEKEVETTAGGGAVTAVINGKKEIVRLLSKYKVTGSSVENLITTVNSMKDKSEETVLENLEIVLKDNSSLLHGSSKMRTHVKASYDMSVLNTSLPAKKIMDMLYNAKKFAEKNPESGAVRMLFYGLSGTGKTEFARYISESLGKELLLKRASDIFDKYEFLKRE